MRQPVSVSLSLWESSPLQDASAQTELVLSAVSPGKKKGAPLAAHLRTFPKRILSK
jgi:hypothetical protein